MSGLRGGFRRETQRQATFRGDYATIQGVFVLRLVAKSETTPRNEIIDKTIMFGGILAESSEAFFFKGDTTWISSIHTMSHVFGLTTLNLGGYIL